jgi:hypothetical protein
VKALALSLSKNSSPLTPLPLRGGEKLKQKPYLSSVFAPLSVGEGPGVREFLGMKNYILFLS